MSDTSIVGTYERKIFINVKNSNNVPKGGNMDSSQFKYASSKCSGNAENDKSTDRLQYTRN